VKAADDLGGRRVEPLDVRDHLTRLLALVPDAGADGGDDLTILRTAPAGELIGRATTELAVLDADTSARVTLRYPARDPDALRADSDGVVPALLVAELEGVEPGTVVAAALDDRIAATAAAFRADDGTTLVTALLPPAWLRTGTHRITWFAVDGPAGTPALRPLGVG
jgi:hypothetical protein